MANSWRKFSDATAILRRTCVALVILLAFIVAVPCELSAQGIVAPKDALRMARDGQITIIDIRRPDEWRKTGVPYGAARATVHFSRGAGKFLRRIAELTGGDKSKPIALICAAGVRSKHASRLLRNRGYEVVLDISEGMQGNHIGVGWLRRGLPVNDCLDCK